MDISLSNGLKFARQNLKWFKRLINQKSRKTKKKKFYPEQKTLKD